MSCKGRTASARDKLSLQAPRVDVKGRIMRDYRVENQVTDRGGERGEGLRRDGGQGGNGCHCGGVDISV